MSGDSPSDNIKDKRNDIRDHSQIIERKLMRSESCQVQRRYEVYEMPYL